MRAHPVALLIIAALGAAALLAAPPEARAETTITAVSGFPQGTLFSRKFEAWVARVNEQGKGLVQIEYKGGAPAIGSPFQLVKRIQSGVFGMASITGAYYTNVLAEADALKLADRSIQELRQNGGVDYINRLHNEKDLYYLARIVEFVPFHLYLNKPITKPDLTGLRIRVTPIYAAFFRALGAVAQQSAAPEVYTLLERGVVDGYGWPIQGIFDFNWQKVTKYRVDPGFYSADIQILLNLDVWKKLDDKQRAFLEKMGREAEATNRAENEALNVEEQKKQEAAGIKVIRFSAADEQQWVTRAKDAAWADVIEKSPTHGPALRKLLEVK